MRILQIEKQKSLEQVLAQIKVDPYGAKIMAPKGISRLIKINSLSNIAANILKQEMLSLGGEVAVARSALTGKAAKSDCLLMGNLAQLSRLNKKLKAQPFGLGQVAKDLAQTLTNYNKENFTLNLGSFRLNLGKVPLIMGILNLTPDSFSGDGLYASCASWPEPEEILGIAEKLIAEGADIIDLGAESSRPGARPVSLKEEARRLMPVVRLLAKKLKRPISIDTCKPQIARQALDYGASVINDITGLSNPAMARVCARYDAGAVIMHMRGKPRTMQERPVYKSLVDEVIDFFDSALRNAQTLGVDGEKIILDPGLGFGKTQEHNLEILKRLKEFKALGRPIMVGPSRKSFIGGILKTGSQERLYGTISTCVLAAQNGAKIVRVHDVKAVKDALRVFSAINSI